MSETEIGESQVEQEPSLQERMKVQSSSAIKDVILAVLVGIFLFCILSIIPMPYLAISLFKFGFAPALSIIAVVGASRGPLAGLLTGYLGGIVSELILNGSLAAYSLYAFALGVLGLVVGLSSYDFQNGRSLGKLSLLSMVGLVFTTLITAVVGIFIEGLSTMAVIAFQILSLLSIGIPSVILLTPLFARLIFMISQKIEPIETA